MRLDSIRSNSIQYARRLGVDIPRELPLLDDELRLRPLGQSLDRLFCMHATAAAAYGFDRQRVLAWLATEGLIGSLLEAERLFLGTGNGDLNIFRHRIEAMWALAWSSSLIETLQLETPCAKDFARLLPNLKEAETSQRLRGLARMRELEDALATCDLAYCLHWAIRQSELEDRRLSLKVEKYVIVERRHALEWPLSDLQWEDVSLDT